MSEKRRKYPEQSIKAQCKNKKPSKERENTGD